MSLILMTSCEPKEPEPTVSSLELLPSSQTGITFQNNLEDNPLTSYNVLSYDHYYNGAGVGLGDFDNDGLVDIFFAGNEVKNEIYRNKGDLKFENKTENSGINKNKNWSSGVSIVDINNDNLLDIYVSQCGPEKKWNLRKNLFYINKGNFIFEELSADWGLDDGSIGTQAVFVDIDKDGDLDVYLLNESKYSRLGVDEYLKELKKDNNLWENSGKLYRNDGNTKFTDITEQAGMLHHSYGLGVSVSDFNGDNYPDFYVSNDYDVPDRLYINQKNGTFIDKIKEYTNSISYYSMGCDIADINNDNFADIVTLDMAVSDHYLSKTLMASMDGYAFNYYTKHLGRQTQYMFNSLQLNNGNGSYSNIAGFAGVQKSDWSWAALLADMNLDGFRDLFVSNGYRRYSKDNDFKIMINNLREKHGGIPKNFRKAVYEKIPVIEVQNQMYINDGDLKFLLNPKDFSYPSEKSYSYGAAYGDLDNDGDLELVVNNIDQPVHIVKNNAIEKGLGNYLTVKLIPPSNNQAISLGSKITIAYGDYSQMAEYNFIRGYLSSMDQRAFFGLGETTVIDRIEIVWADGNLQTIFNPSVNTQLNVSYKKETEFSTQSITIGKYFSRLNNDELGLKFKHQENAYDDFEKEILLPQRQSTMGPSLAIADINGDNLDDIFIGGAAAQKAVLYIQNPNGTFTINDNEFLTIDKSHEDVSAVFVDPDRNGTSDLILGSGGGGDLKANHPILQDRFYANIGGKLKKIKSILPKSYTSTYKLVAGDYNHDEREDILVLGSAIPGMYPKSEPSRLLSFETKTYIDKTATLFLELSKIPLIRDAVFTDINKDGTDDILLVSEWGIPRVFIGSDKGFKEHTDKYINQKKHGWWTSITAVDIDNDGDDDYVLGNISENIKHSISDEKPLYLYANDFDKNGTIDIVLAKDYNGKVVPARGRECSSEQMPFILDKFKTYDAFAKADLSDILGKEALEEAIIMKATTFASYLLRNNNGTLEYEKLPSLAQIAPIYDVIPHDLNDDGYLDLIIAGNNYDTEYETPRMDAGRGLVLINNKGENFSVIPSHKSGLNLNGNLRNIAIVRRKNDTILIGAQNNGAIFVHKIIQN